MKATKDFSYYVNGNEPTLIKAGDDIPEVAQPYAEKYGLTEKAKAAPANKAKKAPQNKAK